MENTIKPLFLQLSRADQKASVEALIFASEEALSAQGLYKILIAGEIGFINKSEDLIVNEENPASVEQITIEDEVKEKFNIGADFFKELIAEINDDLDSTLRPFRIVNVAGGFQFATRPEYGSLINQLTKYKTKKRLSQASMETLSIIAYKQPVSKPEIEQIRGVNSNEIVNSLIEKNLVNITGRSEGLGKPLQYGTTDEFLRVFGLVSITDLPKLRELEEFSQDENEPKSHIELTVMDNPLTEIQHQNEPVDFPINENEEN